MGRAAFLCLPLSSGPFDFLENGNAHADERHSEQAEQDGWETNCSRTPAIRLKQSVRAVVILAIVSPPSKPTVISSSIHKPLSLNLIYVNGIADLPNQKALLPIR